MTSEATITSIAYDDETCTLIVTFVGGDSLLHSDVAPEQVAALLSAANPRAYYEAVIRCRARLN